MITQNKQKQEELWKQLLDADRQGHLIGIGTKSDETMLDKCGLVPGHAYTVV